MHDLSPMYGSPPRLLYSTALLGSLIILLFIAQDVLFVVEEKTTSGMSKLYSKKIYTCIFNVKPKSGCLKLRCDI